MRSKELERAQHIRDCLAKLPALKNYSNRLKGAPAELMENGLLQTLAFYRSKKEEYGHLAEDLESWLAKSGLIAPTGDRDAVDVLATLPAVQYRRCSEEAIAWLNLAKRLALAKMAMAGEE